MIGPSSRFRHAVSLAFIFSDNIYVFWTCYVIVQSIFRFFLLLVLIYAWLFFCELSWGWCFLTFDCSFASTHILSTILWNTRDGFLEDGDPLFDHARLLRTLAALQLFLSLIKDVSYALSSATAPTWRNLLNSRSFYDWCFADLWNLPVLWVKAVKLCLI
jgi:hypothetical protein